MNAGTFGDGKGRRELPRERYKLIHHHVGGRDGSTGFNFPECFNSDILRILYEADPAASPDADKAPTSESLKAKSYPFFIGLSESEVDFNVNYCPYTSSARDLSKRFSEYYQEWQGTDYILGEATTPLRKLRIPSCGLDELVFGPVEVPPPDLLSIDTQGSEDAVLAGASKLLAEDIIAVVTEVSFSKLYEGSPTFGDISEILGRFGFLFVDFQSPVRFSPKRGRLGTRGRGMLLQSDAIFFKDPTRLVADPGKRVLMLRKLAFVALCFGQLEFAQVCLDHAPADDQPPSDLPAYLRLVAEFGDLVRTATDFSPWRFSEAYSAERSEARFSGSISAEKQKKMLEQARSQARLEIDRIISVMGNPFVKPSSSIKAKGVLMSSLWHWLFGKSAESTQLFNGREPNIQEKIDTLASRIIEKSNISELMGLFARYGLEEIGQLASEAQRRAAYAYVKTIMTLGSPNNR